MFAPQPQRAVLSEPVLMPLRRSKHSNSDSQQSKSGLDKHAQKKKNKQLLAQHQAAKTVGLVPAALGNGDVVYVRASTWFRPDNDAKKEQKESATGESNSSLPSEATAQEIQRGGGLMGFYIIPEVPPAELAISLSGILLNAVRTMHVGCIRPWFRIQLDWV